MMILAIDPGNIKSAWILYNSDSQEPIVNMGIQENESLLKKFFEEEFDKGYIDEVVIEMIASYGMPVGAAVFETCVWIGRFAQLFYGLPVTLLYRKDIKLHLCGSARAKDGNIRQALLDRLGPQGTKKNKGPLYGVHSDIFAALAVAVTFADTVDTHKK
jgi:hypothetical protein